MRELATLACSGALSPIDAELGILIGRKALVALGDADAARHVGLAAALLSSERGAGHSCLPLETLAERAAEFVGMPASVPADAEAWRELLNRCGVCSDADADAPTPLVLDGDRLYLSRYHAAECRLATAIGDRLGGAGTRSLSASTEALFARLFPASEAPDLQASAARAALQGGITVITGGPGTGKTSTVARILALLLSEDRTVQIALAAPTGKAAARLAESIRSGLATLTLDAGLRARVPLDGRTLHRLLGYRPWDDTFRHGAEEPLGEDVVVVDEASMVDVLMMDALFAALRPATRVILLGDQDQLASVDTGFVLGDICRAAEARGIMQGAVVRLRRSYRFAEGSGIATLARCIRAGDAVGALDVLEDPAQDAVTLRDHHRDIDVLLAPMQASLYRYLGAQTPEHAMATLGEFRVLCALRQGAEGVAGLNASIEAWLRARGLIGRGVWYDRRPVLVTANDASTGLWNGDVGVVMLDEERPRVWFQGVNGALRSVSPSRMPAHDTAWAMTVHKSQGSEWDDVLLVLPREDAQVLTRELLYTAVTRARRHVEIVGGADVLMRGIGRVTRRASGLADRLRG